MSISTACCYVIISKATNMCVQVTFSNTIGWELDNDEVYNMEVEIHTSDYLEKYYYSAEGSTEKTWWSRTWNAYTTITNVDEETGETWTETVPDESAGYIDTPWTCAE